MHPFYAFRHKRCERNWAMVLAGGKPCTKTRGDAATVICKTVNRSQRGQPPPRWPLFGLCVSRYSSSSSPRLVTTQVRVRSTRGGFFAGFRGKFWTPSSSSQGSEGHSSHAPPFTLKSTQRANELSWVCSSLRERGTRTHAPQSSISVTPDDFLSSFPNSFLQFFSCFRWTCAKTFALQMRTESTGKLFYSSVRLRLHVTLR